MIKCPYCGSTNMRAFYPGDQVFELRDDKWYFVQWACDGNGRWTILCEECGNSWQERTIEGEIIDEGEEENGI